MLTKETEALRYNEGKVKLSYIDFRMFSEMDSYFSLLEKDVNKEDCINLILYSVAALVSEDNIEMHSEVLPKLQALGYRLSLHLIDKPFYNSPAYDLRAFESMAQVLEYGASVYGKDNWRKGYVNKFSAADSLLRHLREIIIGEYIDSESGLPHIGHLMCNIMFLTNDLLYVKRDE